LHSLGNDGGPFDERGLLNQEILCFEMNVSPRATRQWNYERNLRSIL
jgi:hypothetical protein